VKEWGSILGKQLTLIQNPRPVAERTRQGRGPGFRRSRKPRDRGHPQL